MTRTARTFLALLLLLCGSNASAQEISFTASVDRRAIAAGDQVKLTVSLTNSQERFTPPDLGGMVVIGGPFENSSFNYINGRLSSSVSKTWVITATAPGKYTIGAAKVRVGGGMIQTDPITIEVTKGTAPPAEQELARAQRTDPNLFVTISLSKNKAYVGEQVVATYYLYNRYAALEIAKFELPKLNGFWSEEIDVPDNGWSEQVVNGIGYRVAVLKRQLLLPQRSGKLRVEPMELTCLVNRSFFNRGSSIDIKSNAVDFTAIALPPNAPADFNGAVGELEMTVLADRTSLRTNEAVELSVKLSGRSNLKLLDAPKLDFPSDLENYDPKVVDKINVTSGGMTGSREFQYTLIPRHEGRYELGTMKFSYFDTRSGAYRSLESQPLVLDVAPGEGGPTAQIPRSTKSDVVALGEDIRYIRNGDLELRPNGTFLFGSLSWIAGMGTPAIAFLAFLFLQRKRERERGDVQGTRRRKADRTARQHLRTAEQALRQGAGGTFHTSLSKALHGYLSDKFSLGVAEVTHDQLRSRLSTLKDGAQLTEQCIALLAACDMARFAPIEDKPKQQMYEEAVQLIQRIERSTNS
jgi:hypothetical protein